MSCAWVSCSAQGNCCCCLLMSAGYATCAFCSSEWLPLTRCSCCSHWPLSLWLRALVTSLITSPPPCVFPFSNAMECDVRELDASSNKMESISVNIGKCARLKKLKLVNNRLTVLPREISRCVLLEELLVSENALIRLPHTIGKMQVRHEYQPPSICLDPRGDSGDHPLDAMVPGLVHSPARCEKPPRPCDDAQTRIAGSAYGDIGNDATFSVHVVHVLQTRVERKRGSAHITNCHQLPPTGVPVIFPARRA